MFLIIIFIESEFTDEGDIGGASLQFFCCLLTCFYGFVDACFCRFAPLSTLSSTGLGTKLGDIRAHEPHVYAFSL